MFALELVMVAGDFGPTSSVSIRDTIWIYLISKTIENTKKIQYKNFMQIWNHK
jgi:hypothetical protein